MPSAARERSVGRRISSFFGAGANLNTQTSAPTPPPAPPPTQHDQLPERPASRGRQQTQKLRKPSDHLLSPDAAASDSNLPPPDSVAPAMAGIPPEELVAPRAPFTTDGPSSSSRGGSPSSSRPNSRPGSRAADSVPSPAGYHHPTHSGTAPTPNHEEMPPPLLGPSRAKTYSLETEKKLKRKNWMSGSKDKSKDKKNAPAPAAWITGHPDRIPYDLAPLTAAQSLPELWDETGDTLVYLFPQSTTKGPSFRIHSSTFSSSPMLTQLAFGEVYSHRSKTSAHRETSHASAVSPVSARSPVLPAISKLMDSDNSSSSSSRGTRTADSDFDEDPKQINLYVPILSGGGALSAVDKGNSNVTQDDVDALIAVRNMFSFLIGQSLVSTERRPSIFSTFLKIGDCLNAYGFTNIDGSTFGEVAAASFDQYVDELGLADVRASREKTIESLVLGERMRSVLLYNDAFIHAVGKYSDVQEVCQLAVPAQKFQLVSRTTQNRMERASLDLDQREKTTGLRLSNFDFPSVFAGILDSKTASERKQIRFAVWRDAFNATRRHILSYYKHRFGSWPPKASSKKNNLETSGLNRLVIKELYQDFADLYDLYVDRTSLTFRTSNDLLLSDFEGDENEPVTKILRRVFDEYDRAHVPVQPPVPFDTPLIPSLASASLKLSFRLTGDAKQDARLKQKKLKEDDAARLLDNASNPDTLARTKQSPFLGQFRAFEHKNGKNSTLSQTADFRCGIWIFMYAVMQSLPLLAVDAPNVRFAHGVEYFLCEPPRAGVPWANPDAARAHGRVSRTWFGVSGGGVVSLPSDLVEHGVEGVYRRSHCWLRAREWSANLGIQQGEVVGGQMSDEPEAIAGISEPSSGLPGPVASFGPSRISADHTRSASQPFPPPNMPYGNMYASRSAHNLQVPSMAGGLVPPAASGSRPSTPGSPASAPRSPSKDRRTSVLQLGLEALPLPQGVAPHGGPPPLGSQPGSAMHSTQNSINSAPRSRPVTREGSNTGMTFDDIIKGMEAEKGKKGKKK